MTSSKPSRASAGRPAATRAREKTGDAAAPYTLQFLPSALKEWTALDGSLKAVFKKLLAARLVQPHVPGSALRGDLHGCYKIKLRQQGYRLVYEVRDDALVVVVITVGKREDAAVYEMATKLRG